MDDLDKIIVFGVVVIVGTLLYFGVTSMFTKSFNTGPQIDNTGTQKLLQEQKYRTEDVRAQQKRLMEDRKRRMRDMQR